MPLCKQTKPIFVDNYVQKNKRAVAPSQHAGFSVQAGRQPRPNLLREKIERKNVKLPHELKCGIGCGVASGKARKGKKGSRFCLCGVFRVRPTAGVSWFHKRSGLFYGGKYKNIQATTECEH